MQSKFLSDQVQCSLVPASCCSNNFTFECMHIIALSLLVSVHFYILCRIIVYCKNCSPCDVCLYVLEKVNECHIFIESLVDTVFTCLCGDRWWFFCANLHSRSAVVCFAEARTININM